MRANLGMRVQIILKACLVLTVSLVAAEAVALSYRHKLNKSEWQYFLRKDKDFQRNFWQEHKKRQINFRDWSWSWRILWLKSCGLSKEPHCIEVLAQGFRDEAMVVRAEAISQLGMRFRGSSNGDILAQLHAAFMEERNFRHQEVMFIHHNILRAMAMIGGERSEAMRKALSKNYKVADQQKRRNG